MKTYKLNNIEISEESAREFIKNNPELLEKKVSGRYFFPKVGEKYWYTCDGEPRSTQNTNTVADKYIISVGGFRTKEEAILDLDKQQAIVRCWKWQQENAPFEPDWGDEGQYKYFVSFNHNTNEFYTSINTNIQSQFTLPYFKSAEDRDKFIEANKEDLLLLFTK